MKNIISLLDNWLSSKYFLGLQLPSKEQRKNATKENRIIGIALMILAITIGTSFLIREFLLGW